jgi:iron complex transport system substrate-binding protein
MAAAPDLILLRPQHLSTKPALFEALERAGIKLWTKQVLHSSELYGYWRELGALAGRESEAEAMIAGFQKALDEKAQAAPAKRPGVFMESIDSEVKTFTPESIPIWLMTLAGGRNVADDARPARPGLVVADYGPERLLEKAGEIEIFISQEGQMNSVSTASILKKKIYQPIAAFKNGRVYRVPEDLISRPTPSLLKGLEMLSSQIRGEAPKAR